MQETRVIRASDEPLIDYAIDPVFEFDTEVDAHQMLQLLRWELDSARLLVQHATRYMKAALHAAGQVVEDGEPLNRSVLIELSGLSRRTAYTAFETGADS